MLLAFQVHYSEYEVPITYEPLLLGLTVDILRYQDRFLDAKIIEFFQLDLLQLMFTESIFVHTSDYPELLDRIVESVK